MREFKIKIRSPAKVIISGEHAVIYRKRAIAAAIDRFLYLSGGIVRSSDDCSDLAIISVEFSALYQHRLSLPIKRNLRLSLKSHLSNTGTLPSIYKFLSDEYKITDSNVNKWLVDYIQNELFYENGVKFDQKTVDNFQIVCKFFSTLILLYFAFVDGNLICNKQNDHITESTQSPPPIGNIYKIDIKIDCDFPVSAGLGSSAAISSALSAFFISYYMQQNLPLFLFNRQNLLVHQPVSHLVSGSAANTLDNDRFVNHLNTMDCACQLSNSNSQLGFRPNTDDAMNNLNSTNDSANISSAIHTNGMPNIECLNNANLNHMHNIDHLDTLKLSCENRLNWAIYLCNNCSSNSVVVDRQQFFLELESWLCENRHILSIKNDSDNTANNDSVFIQKSLISQNIISIINCTTFKKIINNVSFCLEKIFHKNPSGLDNFISTYGGMQYYSGEADCNYSNHFESSFKRIENDRLQLFVINTNTTHSTSEVIESVSKLKHADINRFQSILEQIAKTSESLYMCLTSSTKTMNFTEKSEYISQFNSTKNSDIANMLDSNNNTQNTDGIIQFNPLDKMIQSSSNFYNSTYKIDSQMVEDNDNKSDSHFFNPNNLKSVDQDLPDSASFSPNYLNGLPALVNILINYNNQLLTDLGVGFTEAAQVNDLCSEFGIPTKITGSGKGGCLVGLLSKNLDCIMLENVKKLILELKKSNFDAFVVDIFEPGLQILTLETN